MLEEDLPYLTNTQTHMEYELVGLLLYCYCNIRPMAFKEADICMTYDDNKKVGLLHNFAVDVVFIYFDVVSNMHKH